MTIVRSIQHNNILAFQEMFDDDENYYVIMELLGNGTSDLFDRIAEKGCYSEQNSINLIAQILDALAYMHSKQIVHRGLKPENIFCAGGVDTEKEIVKIADFSISKIQTDEDKLQTARGTPEYVAPEVLLNGGSYNEAVDMWGIGVITYILLAGYPPFYDETNPNDDALIFDKVINVQYDMDDECWDDVSKLAKDFIFNLIQKNPTDRMTVEQAKNHAWLKHKPEKKRQFSRVLSKKADRMNDYTIRRKDTTPKFNNATAI